MKKLFLLLPLAALLLVGCGTTAGNAIKTVGMAQTANSIASASQSLATVDSPANIDNIVKLMNYEGTDPAQNQALKDAIKKGIDDGKDQKELNKDLIVAAAKNSDNTGTGYLLGYTFGCKAATKDETKCSTDMGAKYQVIMMEQFKAQMPTVPIAN